MLAFLGPSCHRPLLRSLCKSSTPDLARYKEAFARRMEMAGLKPHHRIALGVSGGPDSIALCALTAVWKLDGLVSREEGSGFLDGLLGIVVDHRLRAESAEEAKLVQERVSKMGIQCEIKSCDWPEGRPKQGHLQEAAREKRYEIFQDVCIERQIGVLLIAHHADDQAELLILRLSRNSGVLGLAGMPFASQLFPMKLLHPVRNSAIHGILLVRPVLEFSKGDMYKICQSVKQQHVEDPTNQSKLFARNRIRILLKTMSSGVFRSEIQMLISACRLTRSFVENLCLKKIKDSVTVTDHGYAIIDLEKLQPSNMEDLCLLKFLTLILQFVSQRHRPMRGGIMQLLLDYIHIIPCKTSLTAAGCYISPLPQSKGMKVLVCCSTYSPQSSRMKLSYICPLVKQQPSLPSEVDEIISDAKKYSDWSMPKDFPMPFLHTKSPDGILKEAKILNLISGSTFTRIVSLRSEEAKNFNSRAEIEGDVEPKHKMMLDTMMDVQLQPGQSCHFMGRFLVTWELCKDVKNKGSDSRLNLKGNGEHDCPFCTTIQERAIVVRHMLDSDWLYLAKLAEGNKLENCQHPPLKVPHASYVQLSAQRSLCALKSIPVSARRALPVLVNSDGLPLSIPSIGFRSCPYLSIHAMFRPRIPLGGGYASYI